MNEKKYQSPLDTQATEAVFEAAKQWCDNDTSSKRGAMVMLTDERGTHYQFVGNQERNTRAAVDILTADDMKSAGRAVQIAFMKAMLFIKFDKAQEKAGLNIWEIVDYAERRAAANKLPECMELIEKTRKLNEELKKLWQEK